MKYGYQYEDNHRDCRTSSSACQGAGPGAAHHITLIEESLAAALDQPRSAARVQPVTFKGMGLSREFEGASWDQIRDSIYP
jgi:hypothetical protein